MSDCQHEKVYSGTMLATLPARRPWICRTCGAEGTDADPIPKDFGEYERLKREKRTGPKMDLKRP